MTREPQQRAGAGPAEELDAPTAELLRDGARWLEARAWNRPGTDKSWVLSSMWESLGFHSEVRRAERVADR